MRPDRAEREAERFGELRDLAPALGDARRDLDERVAAARAHLDLGRDQLTDEVRLEIGAAGSGLQILEAVDETERDRVEDRELLLDGDGEIVGRLVPFACLEEQFLPGDVLRFTH